MLAVYKQILCAPLCRGLTRTSSYMCIGSVPCAGVHMSPLCYKPCVYLYDITIYIAITLTVYKHILCFLFF